MMRWNGQNRTETGAALRPLGAVVGVEAYDAVLGHPMPERECRRFARALRHRHLICLRRQDTSASRIKAFAESLDAGEIGGVLAAPSNTSERQSIAFIDQQLLSRAQTMRPEFIYRHQWRAGDVLVWTARLKLAA
jgi:alpha-ketoglutarate-dependent taurine dioxygenase